MSWEATTAKTQKGEIFIDGEQKNGILTKEINSIYFSMNGDYLC